MLVKSLGRLVGVLRRHRRLTRKKLVWLLTTPSLEACRAVYLVGVLTCFAGLATQLALAYAIHKSFIFLRVPLTAAVTPKVVKVLRSWGWQIGKRRAK
jgi:hypothetical protein